MSELVRKSDSIAAAGTSCAWSGDRPDCDELGGGVAPIIEHGGNVAPIVELRGSVGSGGNVAPIVELRGSVGSGGNVLPIVGPIGDLGSLYEGIDHVQLAAPAGSEEEARRFFGGILGWEELPKPEPLLAKGGVWFRCGIHEVHIGVQEPFVPAVKAHPAFVVRDLERLRLRLRERQVAIVPDDRRDEEGIERFYANDPFGNRLEFMARNGRDS